MVRTWSKIVVDKSGRGSRKSSLTGEALGGRQASGRSKTEPGSHHKSVLFDTTFRYDSTSDNLEGIYSETSLQTNIGTSDELGIPEQRELDYIGGSAGESIPEEENGVPVPPPLPPSSTAHPVKDLVSRFRKHPVKDKPLSGESGREKDKEKDESPSQSPIPPYLAGDTKDKVTEPENNWFVGIKGRIARKFEEKRQRSLSVPLTKSMSDFPDDVSVERAEEADPDKMSSEAIADSMLESPYEDKPCPSMEDDSWEKVDIPSQVNQEDFFYRDFGRLKERWIALDSQYLANAYPDVLTQLKTILTNYGAAAVVVMVAMIAIPFPGFMKGFLVASAFGLFLHKLYLCLLGPLQRGPDLSQRALPSRTMLMPRPVEVNSLEGWLNMLPVSSDKYNVRLHHGNHCCTVHVSLHGTTLRLRTPKQNLPRRAMWNEKKRDINAVVWIGRQHFVELEGADVKLLPEGMPEPRLWNKKYPIAIVTEKNGEQQEYYLFGRTCRDKEHWFRLIQRASKYRSGHLPSAEPAKDLAKTPSPVSSDSRSGSPSEETFTSLKKPVDFEVYMHNLCLKGSASKDSDSGDENSNPTPESKRKDGSAILTQILPYTDADTQWVNVVLGRLFYDFFARQKWAEAVRRKFQHKLSKIKMPYFMEELCITDIDLGTRMPVIRRTSHAVHDPATGVWIDMDVAYNGSFQMTLNTKLNLMKLKKPQTVQEMQEMSSMGLDASMIKDDEIPSDDDDDDDVSEANKPGDDLEEAQGATSKRIIGMVDKITQWKYFQHATEYSFIKKKMEVISNTDLVLTIHLTNLVGRLAVNIPPPPTDRVWYGFRSVPRLEFSAKPKMGAKEVTAKIGSLIERLLFQEFQRVLVMPNMDDVQVDLMEPELPPREPI